MYGVVLMSCICLGLSHTFSPSRLDPEHSHIKYATPDTVTMTVWYLYHTTVCGRGAFL